MPTIHGQIIPVGQALLLLIKKYEHDPTQVAFLKKMYFLGVLNAEDERALEQILQDPILKPYHISKEPLDISEDPSRRYFETHFAFELLKCTIKEVDLKRLQQHFTFLSRVIPDEFVREPSVLHKKMTNTFSAADSGFTGDRNESEYHDSLHRLASESCYADFTEEDKEKMALIFKCTYLSVAEDSNKLKSQPPMNHLYGQGFFRVDARGQRIKSRDDQLHVKSQFTGLMKNYMRVPRGDRIVFAQKATNYMRAADKMNFQEDAEWVVDNFKRLVHPFSCSISGTLLYMMQWVLLARERNELAFDSIKEMKGFLRAYIPLMLFSSGGHGFYEYTYPLTLPEFQASFSFMDGFNELTLDSLFFTGSDRAFTAALQKTFPYLDLTLKTNLLSHEIKNPPRLFPPKKVEPATEDYVSNCLCC